MQTRRRLGTALGAVDHRRHRRRPRRRRRRAEATFDRIRRTGVLRIAALPGEMPFFRKDLATGEWSGVAIDMAKSIASAFNAKLEYVESTYANSVLDLQSNKIDLAFALNPTPQRALAIGFTHAYYLHPFGYVARRGFAARTWEDLNKPEIRVVSLIGSLSDVLLARYAPKAQVIGAKAGDDAILLMQAGRADCIIYALIQALERQREGADAGAGDAAARPVSSRCRVPWACRPNRTGAGGISSTVGPTTTPAPARSAPGCASRCWRWA